MAIAEAWIEASYPNPGDSGGWILAVRGEWPASTFADFALDPNGTPKLVVNVANRAGYARSGGQAVPVTRTKQIVATRPLRRPYPDSTSTAQVIDETLNADGTRTVRIALAEPVYQGETVTLSALAGWRATLPAESNVPVANISIRPLMQPWGRWAIPQDEIVDGSSFTVEMVCVSHTPYNDGASLHQPVAGVRFVASDGTNTVSAWALATTESTRFGDSLWCHRATLDLDTLSSGRVTIHAEVYPGEGAVWTTRDGYWDAPHIDQNFKATNRGWQVVLDPRPEVPLCITLDKTGTFLPRRHIVLAPAGQGRADPDPAVAVQSSYAAAAAVAAAERPSTLGAAIDCIGRVTRSVAAANGFSALSNVQFPGGCYIWMPAGTRDIGTTYGSAYTPDGVSYGEMRALPVPGTPRADIVFQKNASMGFRFQRLAIEGCTISSISSSTVFGTGNFYVRLNDVVVSGTTCNLRSGTPGQVFGNSSTGALDNGQVIVGSVVSNLGLNQMATGLIRNSRVEPASAAVRPVAAFNMWRETASNFAGFDVRWDGCLFVNCSMIRMNSGASFVRLTDGLTGTPAAPATRERAAFINCLWERTGVTTQPGIQIGELAYNQARNLIFDGCTMAGARFSFHNDPTQAESNSHFENTTLGCMIDRNSTKHDLSSLFGTHTGGWEVSFGVRQRDTVSADRFNNVITTDFPYDFVGINVIKGALVPGFSRDLGYLDDRSRESPGPNADTGGGDYRLSSSSPGWQLRRAPANYPAYRSGVTRPAINYHAGSEG